MIEGDCLNLFGFNIVFTTLYRLYHDGVVLRADETDTPQLVKILQGIDKHLPTIPHRVGSGVRTVELSGGSPVCYPLHHRASLRVTWTNKLVLRHILAQRMMFPVRHITRGLCNNPAYPPFLTGSVVADPQV